MTDITAAQEPVPLLSSPSVAIAPNASIQPPLSRRGHGPGLILIDPGYDLPPLPSAEPPSETLDPSPQYKWAEEGYAVLRLMIRENQEQGCWEIENGLNQAVDALKALDVCDVKDKFVLFGR
jgi:carboxymethylenebutenolidase